MPSLAALQGGGWIMAKHSDERNYSKHIALFTSLFLPLGAIALVSDAALAQLPQQQHQQRPQQLAQVRRTATRINPPERTNTTPNTTPMPVALSSPAIDNTSALGQALAACNQDAAVQEAFTLPGLKGEVTLDRCYKGRAHLICVFTALSTEATSLTGTYSKIVDANILSSTLLMAFARSASRPLRPISLGQKTSPKDLRN
jgi:hypothetical protein